MFKFIIGFLLAFQFSFSQKSQIDSLSIKLSSFNKNTTEKVDVLNQLAYQYIRNKPDSIIYYTSQAKEAAELINYPIGKADALIHEAAYHYNQRNIEKSYESLNLAIAIYENEKDLSGLAKAYNNYGLVLNNYGDYNEAFNKYEKAIHYSKELNDTLGITRSYVNLANSLSNQSKFDEAIELYEKAIAFAEATNELEQQGNIQNGLAIVAERKGELNQAKIHLGKAREIYEKLESKNRLFIVFNNLANINRKQTDHTEAIRNFQFALGLAKEIENIRYQGIIYNNIANCWFDLENKDKALEMYKKSAEISKPIDQRTYMAGISNIALIYSGYTDDDEKQEEALKLYREVEQHFIEQDSYSDLVNTYNNTADVYLNKKDINQAKSYLKKAVQAAEKSSNKYFLSYTYNQLAKINFDEEKYQDAINYATLAYNLSEEMQALDNVLASAELLVKAYEKTGDFKQALQFQKRFLEVTNDLFDEEKSKDLGKLEAEIEYKALEEKIRLENEKELLEKEISLRRQEKMNMVFGVSLVALLIIILLLIKIKINREKANKELKLSKDKIKNQNGELKELHKQKNKLFSIISHDLRGPLKSIKSFFELALSNDISSKELKDMVPEINRNLESTIVLADNLLNWSSKLVKSQKSKKSAVAILEKAENVENLFTRSLKNKKIQFVKKIDEDLKAYAVESSLELIIRNLVSNSIKFSNENGEIEVSTEENETEVIICIQDNGVGMSPAQAEQIFQGELNSVIGTNNEKGTGIGLLLCKDFVEENGGKIWVEETEINKGTKICFTIPKS